jgi:peptidoglycan/LPS O-acetylase OafA/YrhL
MHRAAAPDQQSDRAAHLASLTGLRFVAAACVVTCHFMQLGIVADELSVRRALDDGRTAVTLFFVLSGFILTRQYASISQADRRAYYVARFARIYPVVVLALAVAGVGIAIAAATHPGTLNGWYLAQPSAPLHLGPSLAAQLSLTTGWFPDPSINQPWDAPAWSISCEVVFYALLPVLLPLLRRMSMRRLVLVGVAAYVVQGLCGADLKALQTVEGGYLLYQFPVVHLPEFLAGVVAALWFVRRPDPLGRLPRRLLIGTATAGIAALALTQPVTPAYYCYTPLFVMLVLGLAARGARTDWLGSATVVLLGEASYSLYLLHMPLGRLFQLVRPPQWTGFLFAAAVIAVSVVSLRCYEAPLRRALRARLGAGRVATAKAAAVPADL